MTIFVNLIISKSLALSRLFQTYLISRIIRGALFGSLIVATLHGCGSGDSNGTQVSHQSSVASSKSAATYYVDCSARTSGNGELSNPINSIASANALTLSAGDKLMIKRGTECQGDLALQGSGTLAAPIQLTSYGEGARPIIRGQSDYAVHFKDQSFWEVSQLDIRGGKRIGLFAEVTNGLAEHFYVDDVNIQDVMGGEVSSKNSGLLVVAPSVDIFNSRSARWNDVRITQVHVSHTNQWAGIKVGDGWNGFPAVEKRSTNITIRNSLAYDVYGDGIILFAVDNGKISSSVVHHAGQQPQKTIGTPNAIWTWACRNCIVEYNEAYANSSPDIDGGGFDIDYYDENNIIQYNYSHDNQGYCMAVFGAENTTTLHSILRFNVCANNGSGIFKNLTLMQYPEIFLATWNQGALDGVLIYNNTLISMRPPIGFQWYSGGLSNKEFSLFSNNLIKSSSPLLDEGFPDGLLHQQNLWDVDDDNSKNQLMALESKSLFVTSGLADANFGVGFPPLPAKLSPNSAAVGAGTDVCSSIVYCNSVGFDIFGLGFSLSHVNIGASQNPF